MRKIENLEALKADPIAAREELRHCFHRGQIGLHLTAENVFVTRTELLGEIS
jgi:hypothetical protein